MRTKFTHAALLLAALAMGACGGGGSGGESRGDAGAGVTPPPSTPGPAPTTTAFTPFVREQLSNTNDGAEPADVNEQEWTFDEDEAAYSDLLEAQGS